MADEPPKKLTTSTLTSADAAQLSENQKAFQANLSKAMIDPSFALELYSNAFQTWQILKPLYLEQDAAHKDNSDLMDKWFKRVCHSALTIGNTMKRNNGIFKHEEAYEQYLHELSFVLWNELMSIKSELGLGMKLK